MKTVAEIGEFELIKRIQKSCPAPKNHGFKEIVPNGDDAYAAKLASNCALAITTDTLCEGTHFNLKWLSRFLTPREVWQAIGYKAMAVNLSDLAAMGWVRPIFSFITLGLNGDISVDSVDNLYTGIRKIYNNYNFCVSGGDIFRAEKSIISVTIVGQLLSKGCVERSGAIIGDVLMASGPLGLSSAGVKILKNQLKSRSSENKFLIRSHLYPEPKLKEGKILANEDILATSMIDSSDDLMTSLEILAEKSEVGFQIDLDSVPIHPSLLKFCNKFGFKPLEFVIYGGEDYQLLFTVHPSKAEKVKKKIPSSYLLGTVKPKSFGIQLKMNGRPVRIKNSRFKHF